MRNAKLKQILESIAYDKGHAYGMEEVDNIFQNLAYELREIDAMLPVTTEPKFKVGDTVYHGSEQGTILKCIDDSTIIDRFGHTYRVMFDGYELNIPEDELSLDKQG